MLRIVVALAISAWALAGLPASADDWTAEKLRGRVLQLVDDQWLPLDRGMVVPDSRVVRTIGSARVTFVRGTETVDIGPNTQIQIYDKAGAKPFTTVKQYFGTVSVEADVRKVQHFAVDTPYLAAVVKGTRFTVTSSKAGSSVLVSRGHVAVEDNHGHSHVTIGVGQSATINRVNATQIEVAGGGTLPTVFDEHGKPVAVQSAKAAKDAAKAADKAAKDAAKADDKATKDAEKAAKDAAKAADKEAKDTDKAVKDAAKAEDKAAKETEKSNSGSGSSNSGNSGSNSSSGSSESGSGDGGKEKKGKDK